MKSIGTKPEEPHYLLLTSETLGWSYFLIWSFSFYGQIYENFKTKSVAGLNFDYLLYNITGFVAYTIYTINGFFYENLGTGHVPLTDVLFSCHALVLTIFTISQAIAYYDKNDNNQRITLLSKLLTIFIWLGCLITIIFELYFHHSMFKVFGVKFNHIIYLGITKVFINVIKYIPQVIFNFKRKCTVGWSIFNIYCDLIGGILSLAQNCLDTYMGHSIISVTGYSKVKKINITKLFLSLLSIFFDLIFLYQHYFLYWNSKGILPIYKNDKIAISNSNSDHETEVETENELRNKNNLKGNIEERERLLILKDDKEETDEKEEKEEKADTIIKDNKDILSNKDNNKNEQYNNIFLST